VGPRGELREGRGQHSVQDEAVDSMGPEQKRIHIHAPKATTPSENFAFKNSFFGVIFCTLLY
jgi:hypothetical protein